MEKQALKAMLREEKGKKARKNGYIPAVLYGKTMPSTSVNFNKKDIDLLRRTAGLRSRIFIDFADKTQMGIVKDVEMHPITTDIFHLGIQVVDTNEIVNWEIPLIFVGREEIESKDYYLQVDISMLKVHGAVKDIPDSITVDVSNMNLNDSVTIAELDLNPNVSTEREPDTVVALVKEEIIIEEEEEEEPILDEDGMPIEESEEGEEGEEGEEKDEPELVE